MWTHLVSGGQLGSLVEEELQGRQAASSAGPVDGRGLQLRRTQTVDFHFYLKEKY